MDLSIKMFQRIIIYILLCNVIFETESAVADKFVCVPGLLTRGATSPKGDIMLEEGDTLELNCTIDLSNPDVRGRTSKHIRFSVGKHEIQDDLLQTTILDNSTAMLRVKNMNVSTPVINCFLSDPETHICQNQVDVGYTPQPVENLKCVARNWASLNCTWNKPRNNILTTYNISYSFRDYLMDCPLKISINKTTESCEWNGRTEPHYRQNMKIITIVMTGVNYLIPKGVRWKYEFHNWEIVIPSKPERLTVEAFSPHEIKVRWSFLNFQLFTPGLDHRVTICPIDPIIHDCSITEFKSNHVANMSRQFMVPYAYTEYSVEVVMKSQRANNTPEFWSLPAIHPSIRTLSKQPEFSPRTGIGTFEVFNKYQLRDVTVYWERIPYFKHNGSTFHYEFTVFEDNTQRREFKLYEGKDYVFFGNLSLNSYRFDIRSVNSEGKSPKSSTVFLQSSKEIPRDPQSVSKVDYTNGTFEISWRHPPHSQLHQEVTSYTVYRCRGMKLQCDELLEWIDINPWETHYVFHGLEPIGAHIFAVSANTKKDSSGMVVATCELVYNKIPGKIKDVSVLSSAANSVEIKWGLDCSFKPGLVQAFRINYCEMDDGKESCKNPSQKIEHLVAGNLTSVSLANLEPFTSYLVWVSMVTRGGESQTSDPILVNTIEAAPRDPPRITTITTTNTTATLGIQLPIKTNGVIRKYEILYDTLDPVTLKNGIEFVKPKNLTMGEDNIYYYNLTRLETNTNYSVRITACTVSCSNVSDPTFVQTKYGYTKITAIPALTYDNGKINISWTSPKHLGGPIQYFELLVRKNGEDESLRQVGYDYGKKSYLDNIDLKCEANTNVTARVRAISIIDEAVLFGDWSPEGSFNCYGNEVWFLWILIVIACLIAFTMLTLVSVKCWRKIKTMDALVPIPPPGMEQLHLNGFSERPVKRMRQNSEGETTSFGNGNLICRESPNFRDETKDFMSSDSKENDSRGQETANELDMNAKNKILSSGIDENNSNISENDSHPAWLWQSSTIPNGTSVIEGELPPSDNSNDPMQSSLPGQSLNSDELLQKRISPTPSNLLISDSSQCYSGDEDDLEHYRTLHFERDEETPSHYNGESHDVSPAPAPLSNGGHRYSNNSVSPSQHNPTPATNDYANQNTNQQNLSNGSVPYNPPPNSAYVKWTSIKTDPIINGKTPYCHVGILNLNNE